MQPTRHRHRLTPCHVGSCTLGKHHLLGDPHSDDQRVPFVLYSFLVECEDGAAVLIDLGPKTVEYCNRMFRQHNFFRQSGEDDVTQPYGNLLAHLERKGIAREQVAHVVYTHLHADHHGLDTPDNAGMNLDFPNALFHVSKTGWEYNCSERLEGRWHSYIDWAFADFLKSREEAGALIAADNVEVRPGVSTVYLGGHSPCSQAVRVETEHGPAVIASDEVYRWDLLSQGALARLNTTPEALLTATDKLASLVEEEDVVLLPCHEPEMWTLYQQHGDDWLAPAREHAVEAVRDYRVSGPKVVGEWPID